MSGPGGAEDPGAAGPGGAEKNQAGGEPRAKASPLQVLRAVLWSFIGIRKSSGYADDVAKIRPVQVIVAGVLVAALFVGSLVVLVKFLTAK
jgi:amino acid transporter